MAPWPDQGNEPKAPDKNKQSETRTVDHLKSKSEPPEDKKCILNEAGDEVGTKKRDVHSLDDGQLKALLDEAIQYKCPKDREGKSKIFIELLKKVEADEKDSNYSILPRGVNVNKRSVGVRSCKSTTTVSERSSRGGSLQNIFHATTNTEFETHTSASGRRRNKQRQGPGSSVSARQREGGSLPSNVNSGWTVESWQSDQVRRETHSSLCSNSNSNTTVQSRRQTLMHSASNELPATKKHNHSELLYPLRRHHSSTDQYLSSTSSSPLVVASTSSCTSGGVKLKSHSESSSGGGGVCCRKMPQVTKPDYVSLDMGELNLEMKTFTTAATRVNSDRKDASLSNNNNVNSSECLKTEISQNDRYRLTPCELDTAEPTESRIFTTRASLEVEPPLSRGVENGLETSAVQLDDNYPSVHSLVNNHHVHHHHHHLHHHGGGGSSSGNSVDESVPGAATTRRQYSNINMISLVNFTPKSAETDENGNTALARVVGDHQQHQQTRLVVPSKKNHKRKQQSEKNVVCSMSQNIGGYRGDRDLETVLSFIESDNSKHKHLKKQLQQQLSTTTSGSNNNNGGGGSNGASGVGSASGKNKKQQKQGVPRESLKKSNSCEELSQRNIEDLTGSDGERSGGGGAAAVTTRKLHQHKDTSSWDTKSDLCSVLSPAELDTNNSDSEFHLVTKKQRKRKTNEGGAGGGGGGGGGGASGGAVGGGSGGGASNRGRVLRSSKPSPRRKSTSSVPPSEKSGDSDVDSVHSLPVGGTRGQGGNVMVVVSYADIAAGNANFRLEEELEASNNNSSSGEGGGGGGGDADRNQQEIMIQEWCESVSQHMADSSDTKITTTAAAANKNSDLIKKDVKKLNNKLVSNNNNNVSCNSSGGGCAEKEEFPRLPVKVTTKEKSQTTTSNCSDDNNVVSVRTDRRTGDNDNRRSKSVGPNNNNNNNNMGRPAVILLHDLPVKDKSEVCGITFGFEINEQLLTGELPQQAELPDNNNEITNLTVQQLFKQHQQVNNNNKNNNIVVHPVDVDKGERGEQVVTSGGADGELVHLNRTTTFVPPPSDAPINFNHDKIVTFVGMAWEDVMRNGEIRYYNEED